MGLSGAPSAFANALIEATRRSGTISRPALMVRSSDGDTSGQMSVRWVGSA